MPDDRLLLAEEVSGATGLVRLPASCLAEIAFLPQGLVSVGASAPRAYRRLEPGDTPGTIGLSPDLRDMLGPVAGVPVRVRPTGSGIDVGPVVAVVAGKRPEQLTKARLRAMQDHLLAQAGRGGLFLVTDASSLRPGERLVDGYCYLGNGNWRKGTYPLPRAIFRRYGADPAPQEMQDLAHRGVRFFNERTFGKWQAYEWMSASPELRSHLPETRLLTGERGIAEMLDRWGRVYVKPVFGSLGLGILRIDRTPRGFRVTRPGGTVAHYESVSGLASILSPRLLARGLVQQGLDLRRVNGRLVDFRTVAQRGGRDRWVISGIIGRYGGPGLPVSNVSRGGRPVPVQEALREVFGASPAELRRRRRELATLGLTAARALDKSGLLLADLGMDLAYDVSNRLWILEVNCRDPHHHLARDAGCWKLYYRLRGTPIEFARHLAGFGKREVKTR
jgi:hypothetical protein